ncbi:hypothetical protein IQ238_06635 [Pleurocapsales cyanobacterium LEGE 06147]|nr:hypothetical protein [Pleurocapsales cyanobacterium LEGE 06147]
MSSGQKSSKKKNWFNKLIAIIALINYALVLFNATYIPARNFYWQIFPALTQLYDPIKAIEPHRETQNYLEGVNELETQIEQTGLLSPQSEALLNELQILSYRLIEDNPFETGERSRILAKIKNEVRIRVGEESARDAFTTFWSQDYLAQAGWQQELNFFNTELRPLIEANYYRDINRFGQFIDYFWLIDLPFIILFALDIIIRTYRISRRNPQLTWLEAILRRWYDFFLVLPFARLLRIIPVTIRLYQAGLLNLEPLRRQLNYDFAISFAEELTELVGIQIIDQMQESIEQGELARWLFHPESRRSYIQIGNRNEAKVIASRLVNISVHDVLPQIQSDVQALVHHSLENTLNQIAFYQQIQKVPGFSNLPTQLTEQLAKNLSQTAYDNIIKAFEDPVGAQLTNRLITNFRDALEIELQKKHNLQEIESLLVDMLEEIKINYVKRIAAGGMEKALAEADQLQRLVQN